jgi:hypothetical protein
MALTLSPAKYGRLLSKTLPKRIENDAEFDRFVETRCHPEPQSLEMTNISSP